MILLWLPVIVTYAGELEFDFDIPPTEARKALVEFAKQANIQLLFAYDAVSKVQLNGLSGRYTVKKGIERLIAGSCLVATFNAEIDGVIQISDQKRGFLSMKKTSCKSSSLVSTISATLAAALLPTPLYAQKVVDTEGIQEIIVTAERRETNLQKTPIAITAMDASVLASQGISDLKGVIEATPSMAFTPYPTSTNTFSIYMRGTGVQDAGQITVDSAVGLYQDGFYIPRGQLVMFDLADVERVEVLRGPQGTLYGRNATGGAVNLISKKPSGELHFKQELGIGNNGRLRSLSVLDLPDWNGLSSKVSILRRKKDGYVKNRGSGRDFGEESQSAGRIALRWDVGLPFSADYFYEQGSLDSTPLYYTNSDLNYVIPGYSDHRKPERRSYRAIDLKKSPGDLKNQGLTLEWAVSDALTLKSLTGYREIEVTYNQNYADTFFVDFHSHDNIQSHQFSEELQALGNLLDGRINYVAGLYYYKETARHDSVTVISNILSGSDPMQLDKEREVTARSESKAFYAQATWIPPVLDDQLELTFGARYTKDNRSAVRSLLNTYFGYPIAVEPSPGVINTNHLKSQRFNPAFTASYHWSDNINTYFRVATGYKAGGSSESVDVGQFGVTFKPENVTMYEVGMKSYFFDRSVRLNMAAFDSKYKDMQLFFNTSPSDLSVILGLNAGKASARGFELDALWQPLDSLSFTFEYAWLDAKYNKIAAPAGTIFDPAVNSAAPTQVGQDIKRLLSVSHAPKNSINLGGRWTFLARDTTDLTLIVNYRWEDRYINSAAAGPAVPNRKITLHPPVGLVDGRVSWNVALAGQSRIRLDVWGNNLLDKKWPVFVLAGNSPIAVHDPVTGTVTPGGYGTAVPKAWAERRTYGIDFSYEF